MGGGNTQWGGTAFNCPEESNEIILSHTFYATEGTHGECNHGAISGHSLGVIGNCYTSQLNVTVQKATSTVQCIHNANSGPIPINVSSITAVSGTNAQTLILLYHKTNFIAQVHTHHQVLSK